jgi:hypothetical protein
VSDDLIIMYLIWMPIQVALAILWFRSLNAFGAREDDPVKARMWAIAYLAFAWFPLAYTLVSELWR